MLDFWRTVRPPQRAGKRMRLISPHELRGVYVIDRHYSRIVRGDDGGPWSFPGRAVCRRRAGACMRHAPAARGLGAAANGFRRSASRHDLPSLVRACLIFGGRSAHPSVPAKTLRLSHLARPPLNGCASFRPTNCVASLFLIGITPASSAGMTAGRGISQGVRCVGAGPARACGTRPRRGAWELRPMVFGAPLPGMICRHLCAHA